MAGMGGGNDAERSGHADDGSPDGWTNYLERFHDQRPGVTEAVFEHAPVPGLGSAYDWLISALPARPGRVVDIACGNAPLQPRLTAAENYLGIDVSSAELAHARAQGRGPVVRADARCLPCPTTPSTPSCPRWG